MHQGLNQRKEERKLNLTQSQDLHPHEDPNHHHHHLDIQYRNHPHQPQDRRPKTKPKEKKTPASSGGASSSSGPATSKQASATKKPPTTIPVQKTNLKKGPATLPHPTKINLQQLRDTLFDAANKGKLNPADTKEIMTMADELSPSKKDIKKRPKKVIHDKMREMYAKYWKTLTP